MTTTNDSPTTAATSLEVRHNQADDLAFWIKSTREKLADLDVCEASARHEVLRSFTQAELQNENEAAALIFDVCRQDLAAGRSGLVRFEVIATDAGGKRVARYAFAIDAGRQRDLTLEDASIATVLVECLRHNRMLVQMTHGHTEEIMRRMGQQLEMAHAQTANVEKQRLQQFEILELLLSNQTERNIQIEKAKAEAKASEQITRSITPIIPSLLGRFVAKQTGEKAPLLPESVRQFMGSIREDQFDGILNALDPGQRAALMEVMIAFKESEDAGAPATQAGASATNGATNGAAHPGVQRIEVDVASSTPNASGGVG